MVLLKAMLYRRTEGFVHTSTYS